LRMRNTEPANNAVARNNLCRHNKKLKQMSEMKTSTLCEWNHILVRD
jgi:hypothetical protein